MSKKQILLATALLGAMAASGRANAAPAYLDRGRSDPRESITITLQLKMPDKAGFDRVLAGLYDRASPSFHHWLSDAALRTFAPAEATRAEVRAALTARGLTVLGGDKNGFSIRARGALGDVARAFHTELHDFARADGEVFRRSVTPVTLGGEAGEAIEVVGGLDSHIVHPMATRAINLATGKPSADIRVRDLASGGLGKLIYPVALSAPQTFNFSTSGGLPTATYSGMVYNVDPNKVVDFSPADLQKVYGLPAAYKKGLNGAGQTVVLLEGYGYPTIQADGNAFAKLTHLPALTAANFAILYPEGPPLDPNAGVATGWNTEIALDLDSAHAIAPGAKIAVVVSAGQHGEDFIYCMQYIADQNIGTTVSDSWEEDQDIAAGPAEQQAYEVVLARAAAKGISFQFSTGDAGDGGLGRPLGAPGVPSVAPHATAVGGTTVVNNPGGKGYIPLGWGDALAILNYFGPQSPPTRYFYAGGGGGESAYWPKPAWQAGLPGLGRQTPDVSALADPFTGVPLVVTIGGQQMVETGWGGTSLATPIFTAFWAIAQQAAGGPLGQASPTLAALTTGLIDVVPHGSAQDVSGAITDSTGTTTYTTQQIFGAVLSPANSTVIAPIWSLDAGHAYAFAFGADSSLTVGKGWDNTTGYGTPYGMAFIDAVTGYVRK